MSAVVQDASSSIDLRGSQVCGVGLRCSGFVAAPAVVLEKVAGVVLDPEILARTLDVLIDNSYLVEADRHKMAAELQKSPNAILRLTEKIASLSAPGHEEGQGVKTASVTETPTAAGEWDIVLEKGA